MKAHGQGLAETEHFTNGCEVFTSVPAGGGELGTVSSGQCQSCQLAGWSLSGPLAMGTREPRREGEMLGATGGAGRVAGAGECGRELRFMGHFGRETSIQSSGAGARLPETPSGQTALQAAQRV